jgi:hypothetical protein
MLMVVFKIRCEEKRGGIYVMCRKHFTLVLAVVLVIAFAGCGLKQLMPSQKVPPLDDYANVLLLPFELDNPPEEYKILATQISYAIGTKMKVRREDKNLIHDQSQEINPVTTKLTEIGISAKDVYADPLASTDKVAEAFGADLIIAGKMDNPKFTREDSGKVTYDMKKTSGRGAARYYTIYQTAMLPADIKIVDVKNKAVIWEGQIIGYKKYATQYDTGSPKKFQRDEIMMADIRRELVQQLVDKLYPQEQG